MIVLLGMCYSGASTQQSTDMYKDELSHTPFPLKTTFPYSSSILFDCVHLEYGPGEYFRLWWEENLAQPVEVLLRDFNGGVRHTHLHNELF
jgi:hypothetical protein